MAAPKLKPTPKKPLAEYLDRDGEVEPRTIRATEQLWDRIEKLSEAHGKSVNLTVIAALEKVCDEEGIF